MFHFVDFIRILKLLLTNLDGAIKSDNLKIHKHMLWNFVIRVNQKSENSVFMEY